MSASSVSSSLLGKLAPSGQWLLLVALSVGVSFVLISLKLPAALFLGPLFAGIALTANGGELEVPSSLMIPVQGLIGCMIARMLPSSISGDFGAHWLVFVAGVMSVIVVCGILGWVVTRLRILPETTALWGLSPGAAAVMTLMAEAHGADTQLVAVMQYLRVVMVAGSASLLMLFWGVDTHHAAAPVAWFPHLNWLPFTETLALACVGPLVGRVLKAPAAEMLFPLIVGFFLSRHGWMTIELPRWLLALAYACVGWRIGLRFTRPLLIHAMKALPRIFACLVILILLCGGIAGILVLTAGIDPITAYLATSPGGADSIAIIAASNHHVDASFVMAMQMMRFLTVLVLGPAIARFMVTHAGASPGKPALAAPQTSGEP